MLDKLKDIFNLMVLNIKKDTLVYIAILLYNLSDAKYYNIIINLFIIIQLYYMINNINTNIFKYSIHCTNISMLLSIPLLPVNENVTNMHIKNIIFKNASIGYSKENPILKNVNLQFSPGNIIFLSGQSGSGKTSLIKVIKGESICLDGEILVSDGSEHTNVNQIEKSKLISILSHCPQTLEFPNKNIREFMSLMENNLSDTVIYNILKKVNLYHTVMSKPLKLDTYLGNNAMILSGGQRARLFMAMMLTKLYTTDNNIFLILDETLDSLDQDTTKNILTILFKEVKNKRLCIICISHKLNSIISECIRQSVPYTICEIKESNVIVKHFNSHIKDLNKDSLLNVLNEQKPKANEYTYDVISGVSIDILGDK